MDKFIGALDQGTTSTRFIIFNKHGEIVASDQKEHAQIYPQPGWVEHNPMEIWENTKTVFQNALRKSGIDPKQIDSIGITNQRETTIVWDRTTGLPYSNAIVWQDTRTGDYCKRLSLEGGIDRFRQKTGLPVATYFSGPKLHWLFEQQPQIRVAAQEGKALFGTVDSWLIWNLTGGSKGGKHATDVTNASRTMLMNLKNLCWDSEILELLQIPENMLPEIKPSTFEYGYGTDIFKGIAIGGVLGDQQAALFGQTCFEPGSAKNTYGTGCFMLLNTGIDPVQSKNGLITTVGYKIKNEPTVYCLEGSIAIAGALVQWMRDNLNLIETSADIEPLARTVQDNGGIYFVPAFSGLFAPYWRADARGAIVGMTRYTNKGHLARAALEATAYQTCEVLQAMESDSKVKLSTLKVDGGMVHNDLLMKFQADILNVPVVRPVVAETTALGAAYAAGLAVGYWNKLEELQQNWGKDKEWIPDMPGLEREKLIQEWKKAVERTFNWV